MPYLGHTRHDRRTPPRPTAWTVPRTTRLARALLVTAWVHGGLLAVAATDSTARQLDLQTRHPHVFERTLCFRASRLITEHGQRVSLGKDFRA